MALRWSERLLFMLLPLLLMLLMLPMKYSMMVRVSFMFIRYSLYDNISIYSATKRNIHQVHIDVHGHWTLGSVAKTIDSTHGRVLYK